MKLKILYMITAILCLSIFLSACSVDWEHAGEVFGVDPNETVAATQPTETAPVNTSSTAPQADDVKAPFDPTYPYGNRQASSGFIRHQDYVLFESVAEDPNKGLFTYDLETGAVSPFCKDATCTHKTSKCVAYEVTRTFESWNGRLFATLVPFSMYNYDRIIVEWKNGRFEEVLKGIRSFWHAGNDLYVKTLDRSLLVYENGSDQPRVLIDEYIGNYEVVFGDYLYGQARKTDGGDYSVYRIDLRAENPQKEYLVSGMNLRAMTDGQHIYYKDDSCYLYRCNMDGSEPTLLYDEQLVYNMNFDNEYFYFGVWKNENDTRDLGRGVYRMDKADPTKVVKIAELPEAARTIYTVPGYDKIFVEADYVPDVNPVCSVYTVAIDGSGWEKLEIPEF